MSDFDKEAERERLREKYERDQEKRAATEQMSELLLKGATMTNSHCENCGDPIFRYQGEEFCPTCQQVVTDPDGEADDAIDGTEDSGQTEPGESDDAGERADASGGSAADGPAPSGSTPDEETGDPGPDTSGDIADTGGDSPSDSAGTVPGRIETKRPTGPAVDPGTDAGRGPAEDEHDAPRESGGGRDTAPTPGDGPSGGRGSSAATGPPTSPAPTPSAKGGESGGPLAEARASLTRTLRTQARLAEQCEDPRRARDHLAAAREAAEALSALY